MKKILEKTVVTWVWLCAAAILLSTMLMLVGFAVLMFGEGAEQSFSKMDIVAVLPKVFRETGFTLSTAVFGVLLATPLALSLSIVCAYLLPSRIGKAMGCFGYAYSAVPAVVMGFMAFRYVVPGIESPWVGLVLSLALMAIPRLFSEYYVLFKGDGALRIASACLGGSIYQTIVHFGIPAHTKEMLLISLGAVARAMCEGVAVMIVLFSFREGWNTLVTGTMMSLGVTTTSSSVGLAIVQIVALLLPLSILYITSYVLRERRNGYR